MNQEYALRVNKVSKHFLLPHQKKSTLKAFFINPFSKFDNEKQTAFKDISFDIKKGDFFGIVGRNGSGKSTLLKCIAGVYATDSGSITVDGKLVPFIELGVGFNPELSGRDNVFLNGALLGFSRKEITKMYDEIVEFAELEKFMDQKLMNYSSGMQVRLAFSIAIRARADILLLDEVLAVGDTAFQQKCFDYFEQLKKEKRTIILVTHGMDAVKRFCNRAMLLDGGRIKLIGSPDEVADMYLQDNIEEIQKADNKREKKTNSNYKINISSTQTDNKVTLKVRYSSNTEKEMYVGISILKDGISIAELTTPNNMELINSGQLEYELETNFFNSGIYRITAVLCEAEGRRLQAVSRNNVTFKVVGRDVTRGGALKLPAKWKKI
jgi:ABC-2 type transport system ATP-binding protein